MADHQSSAKLTASAEPQTAPGSIDSLRARGYDVAAICAPGKHVAEVEPALASVFAVPITRRITPLRDLQSLIRLIRILYRERPEIIHTHTPKANLLGQLAARLTNVPVRVSTVHGLSFTRHTSLFKRWFLQIIETLSARFASLVFLINQEDLETALALRVCRPGQVKLLPGGMGIDLASFNSEHGRNEASQLKRRELGVPDQAVVVGFVGRLVREKGLLELFEAFGRTRKEFPNLWLLIVGPDDSAKPDALPPEMARRYSIADQAVFTGLRTDTADLYGLMDIFVLPSHREGMPLSIMEAQAMGLPIITTDARGCRESIVPGRTGIIVPARSTEALAGAMLFLASNAEVRRRMGDAGRQLAKE